MTITNDMKLLAFRCHSKNTNYFRLIFQISSGSILSFNFLFTKIKFSKLLCETLNMN